MGDSFEILTSIIECLGKSPGQISLSNNISTCQLTTAGYTAANAKGRAFAYPRQIHVENERHTEYSA